MDPTLVALEPARAEHARTLLPLIRRYFEFDGLLYGAHVETAARELLDNPALGGYFLLHLAGQLVGYCCLTYGFDAEAGGRILWVTDLYLVEGQRGLGIGQQVIAYVISMARAEKFRAVCLAVIDGNAKARRLYERHEFAIDKDRSYFTLPLWLAERSNQENEIGSAF